MASKTLRLCEKDKLAVLGTASSLPMAPFRDNTFEIWGVSPVTTYDMVSRVDVLFEMHSEGYWSRPDIFNRLKSRAEPLYMLEKTKRLPNSMTYPKDLILKYRKYHTTSITYMLALAYHSFVETGKPMHVALFGVHMESEEEYQEQRPCCEYWIGRMEGAGIDVFVAPGGALLVSPGLYGYENYNPICYDLKARIKGLAMGEKKWREQAEEAMGNAMQQVGAQKEANYWLRFFQKGQTPKGEAALGPQQGT